MLPAISIVGHSKSGKTTLIEHLIGELKKRGRALLGARRSALMRTHQAGYAFDDLLNLAGSEADIVLIEGLSSGPYPKIEVHRDDLGLGLRCKPEDLLAVVTDRALDIGCKQFSLQEIGAIADLIEQSVSEGASEKLRTPVGDTI